MMKTILFLVGFISLCSSTISFTSNDPNVLARIYDNYTQLYRPATVKSVVKDDQTLEQYRFYFTEEEYGNMDDDSLILLYANVVERTVIYHPNPNVETVGTRYLYRLNSNDNTPTEIELVNVEDRLFRNVQQPNQYFYLQSFDNLIYLNQTPIQPYYELIFLTNRTTTPSTSNKVPLLSYLDRSISYTPRYFLNLPSDNSTDKAEFIAYADLVNNETYPIVLKGVELIVKDSSSNQGSFDYLRANLSDYIYNTTKDDIDYEVDSYVYQLTSPVPIVLPPRSVKSVQFLETNLSVVPYLSLSTIFAPINITGNVIKTYNLTSFNEYLPSGKIIYHDQGRFAGEFILPDLVQNETFVLTTDADSDVIYRRQVQLVPNNETDSSISYMINFTFENDKQIDVEIDFAESFELFKNFEITDLSDNLFVVNDNVEGTLVIPAQGELTQVFYRVTLRNN